MKLIDILKFAEEYLLKYSFSKPRLEAEKVIAHVLGCDRMGLYTNFESELSTEEREEIKKYLKEMSTMKKTYEELEKNAEKDYKTLNLELLNKSIKYLEDKGVTENRLDAEYIFSHVLNCSRSFLNFNLSKEITDIQKDEIKKMIIQRGKFRKPLQQILGEWEFYGHPFKVNEHVLIPRQDTEILVEQCKFLMIDIENPRILDIGTGSGAIGVTLAKELPKSYVTAVDISDEALKIATSNGELNCVKNIEFKKSDVLSAVEGEFDLIVSNPPYIPIEEYNELMVEVREHEPRLALTDNGDGYYFYDKISKDAKPFLKKGGYLAFEVGYNQAEKVAQFAEDNGLVLVGVIKDYAGIDRVVISRRVGE
ncbi:MAG: peptide chain release factor N(5)-glutamine methyltransferase [Fusobacteriaceae bacterium]